MKASLIAAAILSAPLFSLAQSVVTDPVGFVSVTVPAQSDAALGAPLGRANEFQGVIQSISGNVLTLAGTPGWTTNQFVYVSGTQPKTYYARIDSGAREGLIATITANDSASLTITVPSGDDLNGVLTNAANGTGDSISIAPYWTFATLISGVPAGTNLLIYPTDTAGVNLAPTIYVYTGANWQKAATVVDDTILPPMQGFTLRNNTSSAITVSITGSVPMASNRQVLKTLAANTKQDQRIFFNSPVPELVGNTGLGTTPGDQLFIIDNSATGKNKASSTTLTWTGSTWINGSQGDVSQTFYLQPGTSYILRKAQSASPSAVVATHLQSYLQ